MEFVIENNGCRLHGVKYGKGPVLLLIHGAGSDGSYFTAAMEELQRDYTVVTYDRCGYSKSHFRDGSHLKENPIRYSVKQQSQDAKVILDALQAEQAVVAGVSAGGIIALQLAQQYPDCVSKLILYEPPLAMEEPYQAKFGQWLSELQETTDKKQPAAALLKFYMALGGTDPDVPGISLRQQGRNIENLKVFLYYEMQDFLTYGERHTDGIHLSMPCVLGAGMKDAKGLCSQAAPANANALGCHLSKVNGYHNFAGERPEQFAVWIRQMIDFL